MNVDEMRDKYLGTTFDVMEIGLKAERLAEFAIACGETASKYVDIDDPDFQAVPNYTSCFHGTRMLPKGFPFDMMRSFDAGKTVEILGVLRPTDRVRGESEIADIFEKSGRSGKMLFVVHRMKFFNQDDEKVSIVDWKMVQREFDK